jgi:hypothetical protein
VISVVDELPLVTPQQRAQILASRRTAAAHRVVLQSLPAMNAVQTGGTARAQVLLGEVSVVAWNLERCLFPEQSAAHLAPHAPDILLLSEVDHGMARTGQRHTTEVMAQAMGMGFAFGVEFHELDLGGPTERQFCIDDVNARGWHGNAILSRVPFDRVTMVRLDDHGHWFSSEERDADPDQPRVGGAWLCSPLCQRPQVRSALSRPIWKATQMRRTAPSNSTCCWTRSTVLPRICRFWSAVT